MRWDFSFAFGLLLDNFGDVERHVSLHGVEEVIPSELVCADDFVGLVDDGNLAPHVELGKVQEFLWLLAGDLVSYEECESFENWAIY